MWFLLIQDGRRVGYLKRVGETTLYTPDGHVFSGRAIPHDRAVPQTRLRTLSGARVFEGDVVELSPRPGAPFVERLVLVDDQGRVRLGRPRSTRVDPLDPAEAVPVRRRVGSVHTERYYRRRYAAAAGSASAEAGSWASALRTSAAALGGGAISALIQLRLGGSVGPLTTLAGGMAGLVVALRHEAQAGRRLRHGFLLRLASRSSILTAAALGGLYLLAGSGPSDRPLPELAVGTVSASVLGFFATFAMVAMVGGSLDHYGPPAEPSRSPGPRPEAGGGKTDEATS